MAKRKKPTEETPVVRRGFALGGTLPPPPIVKPPKKARRPRPARSYDDDIEPDPYYQTPQMALDQLAEIERQRTAANVADARLARERGLYRQTVGPTVSVRLPQRFVVDRSSIDLTSLPSVSPERVTPADRIEAAATRLSAAAEQPRSNVIEYPKWLYGRGSLGGKSILVTGREIERTARLAAVNGRWDESPEPDRAGSYNHVCAQCFERPCACSDRAASATGSFIRNALVNTARGVSPGLEEFGRRVEEFRREHADFDAVALADDLPITQAMTQWIMHSARGPAVAYHLGLNSDVCRRISQSADVVGMLNVFATQLDQRHTFTVVSGTSRDDGALADVFVCTRCGRTENYRLSDRAAREPCLAPTTRGFVGRSIGGGATR